MADLGTITAIYPSKETPRPLTAISDYDIHKGLELGLIDVFDNRLVQPVRTTSVAAYIVRQIVVVFRQLWPTHGQRFPQ